MKIQTDEDLKNLATILHDARFSKDNIGFDRAQKKFSLTCWQVLPNDAGWKELVLSLSNVEDAMVSIGEAVPYYEIATVRFDHARQTIQLVTHYAVEISLHIGGLQGTLTETGQQRVYWK